MPEVVVVIPSCHAVKNGRVAMPERSPSRLRLQGVPSRDVYVFVIGKEAKQHRDHDPKRNVVAGVQNLSAPREFHPRVALRRVRPRSKISRPSTTMCCGCCARATIPAPMVRAPVLGGLRRCLRGAIFSHAFYLFYYLNPKNAIRENNRKHVTQIIRIHGQNNGKQNKTK